MTAKPIPITTHITAISVMSVSPSLTYFHRLGVSLFLLQIVYRNSFDKEYHEPFRREFGSTLFWFRFHNQHTSWFLFLLLFKITFSFSMTFFTEENQFVTVRTFLEHFYFSLFLLLRFWGSLSHCSISQTSSEPGSHPLILWCRDKQFSEAI